MTAKPIVSTKFPYFPLSVSVERWQGEVTALLDTGFTGDLILPVELVANGKPPFHYQE